MVPYPQGSQGPLVLSSWLHEGRRVSFYAEMPIISPYITFSTNLGVVTTLC